MVRAVDYLAIKWKKLVSCLTVVSRIAETGLDM